MVTASDDCNILIWDFKEKCQKTALKGLKNGIDCVAITHDSEYVVTGGDKALWIWNSKKKYQEKVLEGHCDFVNSVAISRSNKFVVSGSKDKTARVWKLPNKQKFN